MATTVEQIRRILRAREARLREELAAVVAQLRTIDTGYIEESKFEEVIDLARLFDRGELGPLPDDPPPTEGA